MERLKLQILTFVTVVIISGYSHAGTTGFEGAKVQLASYCCTNPTESNRISDVLIAVVGSETEFPLIENSDNNTDGLRVVDADVDINNTQIEIDYAKTTTLASGLFNGYVFDFGPIGTIPDIKSISLNSATTFDESDIDLSFDSDTIRISLPGQRITPDSLILVDVLFHSKQSPPEVNDCVASYTVNGVLNIPCVSVPDAFGGIVAYKVEMNAIPLSNPLSFELSKAEQIEETSTSSGSCVATYIDGLLDIPCVLVPDAFGGTSMYQADMELIPFSSPFVFKVRGAKKIN